MRQFSVNGVEKQTPLGSEDNLDRLLEHIREAYTNEVSLITSIRIDGNELGTQEEKELAELPLSSLDSVEVFTSHPREVAEETLQMLLDFTHHLENYSRAAADSLEKRDNAAGTRDLTRLIDGVSTFIESLVSTKRILRMGALSPGDPIGVLEADLLSILKDLTGYFSQGELAYVTELLREHLPANLIEWREKGIPSIIRARDS